MKECNRFDHLEIEFTTLQTFEILICAANMFEGYAIIGPLLLECFGKDLENLLLADLGEPASLTDLLIELSFS